MICGWGIVCLHHKAIALKGLTVLAIPVLLYIGYCTGFQHKFGFFAPSIISTYNSDINIRTSMVTDRQTEEAGSALEAAHLEAMNERHGKPAKGLKTTMTKRNSASKKTTHIS